MKKVLLATSALVMMGGAASAEISLSGSARMGIFHISGNGDSVSLFSSRVRIVFTASGETDSGLSFGASVRHDQDDTAGPFGILNGENTVFISGAFGKLTMGDVSGAADALVGQVSGVGYGPLDNTQEINFIGTLKTAAYYEYSTGALTFGVGVGQMELGQDTYNVGVKYAADGYSAAIAWETIDGVGGFDMISLGGSATFGAATVKARVSDVDISGIDTAYALSVDYVTGPTTFTAFYTDYGNGAAVYQPSDYFGGDPDVQHIGVGVAYDLGGGATLAAGVTRQNNSVDPDFTFADLGLKFSF